METQPISNWSWRKTLNEVLSNLPKIDRSNRIALIGVGSELRGDDAAGLFAARRLINEFAGKPNILVYEAGQVPENAIGPLRRFSPDIVVILDAAQMGEPPGTIHWVAREEIDGFSASTHTFPLSFIMEYFSNELNCPVQLLAIQSEHLEFSENISPTVLRAVDDLVNGIVEEIL